MTIDNAHAVRAFAKARIDALRGTPQTDATKARIDELLMIVALCDGLQIQAELLDGAIPEKLRAK